MRNKLQGFLFEDENIEEAMAIGAGGASMVSSGQVVGGPPAIIGPKRKKKKGELMSASPAVHDPDALALKEMHSELFEFDTTTDRGMARLWADQPDVDSPEQPVKSASPLLDKDISIKR